LFLAVFFHEFDAFGRVLAYDIEGDVSSVSRVQSCQAP
jgi:hypothetical protein